MYMYLLLLIHFNEYYNKAAVTKKAIYEQNNYLEGSGSATKNNAAHHKYPEEGETSPNRNHIITSKQ